MKPRSSGTGRPKNSSGTKRLGAKTGAPRGAKSGAKSGSKQAPRQSLKERPKRPSPVRDAQGPRAPRPDQHGLGGAQIEGRQAVRELLIARKRRTYEVWISNDIEDNEVINDIIELANDQRVPVRRVARKEIEREARSEAPQGVLAMAAPIPDVDLAYLIGDANAKKAKLLIAVDGVTDPGNLGAILRSCDGAGVDGVILPRHRAVHITPTAAKSAAGAAEYVPMCVVGGLPTALQQMKDAGVWIVGLHDAADKSIFELGSLGDESICLVLGAEGSGLSRLVRERCDVLVNIPMLGALSSLNVSVAAALATYEVVRLRKVK